MFCISGGRPFIEKLKKAAAGRQRYYRLGKLRLLGFASRPPAPIRPQATPIDKVITDKPIVKSPWMSANPGCHERHYHLYGDV
ncbi:hydrogenase-1 small chain [Salmonella enterica subsp. enterica]|uniref:Hydrogenase-1 small chain n=1 Tax=Salmonella enterica I TaxID=59201 RepID=A0A3S4LXN5_SALET|nr:hydrogenase-1 small chain [Salmonella enterica subsp. enterica]